MELDFTVSKSIAHAQYCSNKSISNIILPFQKQVSITRLETIGLTLNQSVDIREQLLYEQLEDTPGKVGAMAFIKLQDTLQKYTGYQELKLVSKVLQGKNVEKRFKNEAH
ncbi:hypothetical protein Zmor_001061 [Zophobas morio]|uniref:Uncharacterized protein n=1 Tax=Zophobas morio TaxID=2755281 RepID=A0AA38MNZ4_9CUCU|nr:hypothetical protein Zmor_001061 [Zophobas morio]